MSWIDRPEVRIVLGEDGFRAELRGGHVERYEAIPVRREAGDTVTVCPTLDHVIAAAGW